MIKSERSLTAAASRQNAPISEPAWLPVSRLGSPAVSDGGLGWLYDFMAKADAAKLRVDFVAVHYYRAVEDPGDGKAAADQFFKR